MKYILVIISFLILCFPLTGNAQQKTYTYTGDVQTYVVPPGVTEVTIDLYGAEGGDGSWEGKLFPEKYAGGKGGHLKANYPVEAGQKIYVYVGGKGEDAKATTHGKGGFNGGGTANNSGEYGPFCGGGGGGASDIRIDGKTLENRVLVAGGGGGAGVNSPDGGDHGGAGGSKKAANGKTGDEKHGYQSYGTGGTQTAGGSGGNWAHYPTAEDGKAGFGGDAADSTSGGGGGAGWYGGGGGCWSGGGGGSSYANEKATNVKYEAGVHAGNGMIIITPGCTDLLIATTTKGTLCENEKTTLLVHGANNVSWSDGVEDGVPFTPPAGVNKYKVVRHGDCPGEAEITIVVNQIQINGTAREYTPDHSGSIEVDVHGGTYPYTYKWRKGERVVSSEEDLENLTPGDYQIEVTDAIGCKDKKTFTINEIKPDIQEAPGPKLTADISEDQEFVTVGYPGPFEYKIENMSGQTVITGHAVDKDVVDITRLKSGKYRVSLIYKQIKQYTTFVKD